MNCGCMGIRQTLAFMVSVFRIIVFCTQVPFSIRLTKMLGEDDSRALHVNDRATSTLDGNGRPAICTLCTPIDRPEAFQKLLEEGRCISLLTAQC